MDDGNESVSVVKGSEQEITAFQLELARSDPEMVSVAKKHQSLKGSPAVCLASLQVMRYLSGEKIGQAITGVGQGVQKAAGTAVLVFSLLNCMVSNQAKGKWSIIYLHKYIYMYII